MADSFHVYLKKQLLDYVESERKKGVPLEEIEKSLLNAGHEKNVIDEVMAELKKEEVGKKAEPASSPVEKDIMGMLKKGFSQFMAQAKSEKDIKDAKEDIGKTDTQEVVKEVIQDAEVIEEKTMFEGAAFFIYLVALALIIIATTATTDSQIVNVALGFAPALISIFASFLALSLADNVPIYVAIPLGITSIFYAIGRFGHIGLFANLDIEALSLVNFVVSFMFNITIVYVRFIKPRSMKRRVIKQKPAVIPLPSSSQKSPAQGSEKEMPKPRQEIIESKSAVTKKQYEPRKEITDLKKEFNIR